MVDAGSDVIDWLAAIPWEAPVAIIAACITLLAFVRPMLIARTKRKKREKLGDFLHEGKVLETRCAEEKKPPPSDEADDWDERVNAYLEEHLGSDYVASFSNAAGLPMGLTSINSREHRNLHGAIGVRLARLQQFLEELRR